MSALKYKRVLLKLSGEALAGGRGFGVDPAVISQISEEIVRVHKMGCEIGIVIGGGNIVRGVSASALGMERTAADQMGMLGTVINCIAMQDAIEKLGVRTRVMSAIKISAVCEFFIKRRAIRHLEKGRITLFGAGTGNPYFTTDSAATLRAIETQCDVIMKATKVDGVYDSDPMTNLDAVKYNRITYTETINKDLKVMDTSAIALCRENDMPILVFKMGDGNFEKAVKGEVLGTLVNK